MQRFQWTYGGINFGAYRWTPEKFGHIVLLIHGIGEYAGRYQHVAAFFNRQHIAMTAIDLFGHGYIDQPRGASRGIEFTLDYLTAFIDYNLKFYNCPVILYGQSMGGGLGAALRLRRDLPIQASILTSPGFVIPAIRPFKEKLLPITSHLSPGMSLNQGFDLNKMTRNRKVVDAFRKDALAHVKVSVRLAYEMIRNGRYCIKEACRLEITTLLMHMLPTRTF